MDTPSSLGYTIIPGYTSDNLSYGRTSTMDALGPWIRIIMDTPSSLDTLDNLSYGHIVTVDALAP